MLIRRRAGELQDLQQSLYFISTYTFVFVILFFALHTLYSPHQKIATKTLHEKGHAKGGFFSSAAFVIPLLFIIYSYM
jgi:hypothetical protein